MSQTLSPSSARCYGLARVALVWSVSRASVYRSLKETPPNTIARRPGPVGACSDSELADHIRQQIAASRLHGEGYRKLWALRAYVFVAVEHANSEVVGIHAARSANRFEALEPVRQGVHRCFGSIAPGVARGLMLRHDHGSNYMSGDFQEEIECLGIEASPSFVREPQGNGVAERFIRTLKENLLWARTFDTIEELRAALVEFARHYNETWLVARHGNRTPAQVRAAQSQLDQNAMTDLKLAA